MSVLSQLEGMVVSEEKLDIQRVSDEVAAQMMGCLVKALPGLMPDDVFAGGGTRHRCELMGDSSETIQEAEFLELLEAVEWAEAAMAGSDKIYSVLITIQGHSLVELWYVNGKFPGDPERMWWWSIGGEKFVSWRLNMPAGRRRYGPWS